MASITARGKRRKTYFIRVSLGFKADGGQKMKTATFIPPPGLTEKQGEKAARAFAADFEAKCRGLANFDDSMTFEELLSWYFETVAPEKLRRVSVETRRSALGRHILPALGKKRLREITPALISAHFAALRRGGLAAATVNTARQYLSAVFGAAAKQKIIPANPVNDTDTLRRDAKEQPVLTPAQIPVFLERAAALENIGARGLLITILGCGARPGELRALTWGDINFERGLMDINKAADVKGRVGPPKSKASYRVLPVSMLLLNFLSHHRRAVENMAAGMGAAWRERGLVFPNSFGGYIPHSVLTRAAKRVIAGTGIAPELHPHSLRHTFASVLIRGGADIKTVQALLGHGSAHTTLNIYSHSFDEARAAAMNGAGDAIFGGAEMAALAPPPDQNLIKLDQYLINVERKNAQNGATG